MRRTSLLLAALTALGALVVPTTAGADPTPGPTTTTPAPADPTTTTTVPEAPTTTTAPPAAPTTTTVAPTSTTAAPVPAPTAPTEGTTGAPKVRGVGDSVFHSAQERVVNRLQPEYRPRFRSVLGALVREMTPTALDMAGNHPAALVFGLGNPDIAELDSANPPNLQADAAYLIRRTRNLPCTVWINLKENGVNAFYNAQWAAEADEFNDFLVAATVDGPSLGDLYAPNLHILDWNATAASHPGWFLEDGLHLNTTGQAGYAGKVDRVINRVCPP